MIQNTEISKISSGFRPERCPKCGSTYIIKSGIYLTRKAGKQQRYQCRECGFTIVPRVGR